MFKNYLKIAFRNIKKYKGYSFINIAELAIGITCCILILLWVHDELNYDRFHKNLSDIYRIISVDTEGREETKWSAKSPPPMAQALKDNFPEVIKATRFGNFGRRIVKYGDISFNENRLEHVDPDFFEMFSFPFASGNLSTALSEPNSIILTEEMAKKYFGRR